MLRLTTISKRSISRLTKSLVVAMCVLALPACAVSAPSSSVGVHLPPLPAKLISVSCDPTTLPSGALSKAQVEQLWARDRARLVKCGYSLSGLISFYIDLSRKLGAADQS